MQVFIRDFQFWIGCFKLRLCGLLRCVAGKPLAMHATRRKEESSHNDRRDKHGKRQQNLKTLHFVKSPF